MIGEADMFMNEAARTEYENETFFRQKYENRIINRIADKPLPVKVVMYRTYTTAMTVLSNLRDHKFEDIVLENYILCKDAGFDKYVAEFSKQIGLAIVNEEKFIFGLHSFYNKMANQIRKENKYYEWAQFTGIILRECKGKRDKVSHGVIIAYGNLIMQMVEYIRPVKSDLKSFVYGVSTNGEVLVGEANKPYCDLPAIELMIKEKNNKNSIDNILTMHVELEKLYNKYGMEFDGVETIDRFAMMDSTHCNCAMGMFHLINEYTFDMITEHPIDDIKLAYLEHRKDREVNWRERLKLRDKTLPTNGVVININDPTGELKSVKMKETVYADSVHMLYKIEFDNGSMSGYYDNKDQYLFSTYDVPGNEVLFKKLEFFILSLYATQVLDGERLESIDGLFRQSDYKLTMSAVETFGKLRDNYHKEQSSTSARDLENYDKKDTYINAIIRQLPVGQKASDEAKNAALEYGYKLKDDQTFVKPFIKQVFVRKEQNKN